VEGRAPQKKLSPSLDRPYGTRGLWDAGASIGAKNNNNDARDERARLSQENMRSVNIPPPHWSGQVHDVSFWGPDGLVLIGYVERNGAPYLVCSPYHVVK
jgi:hypothetical protein